MSMKVFLNSVSSSHLRDLIYTAIQKKSIRTWAIHDQPEGRYLTHSTDQWNNQGFLKLNPAPQYLSVDFIGAQGVPVTDELKAVYQGRFAEMLYAHDRPTFESQVAKIEIALD